MKSKIVSIITASLLLASVVQGQLATDNTTSPASAGAGNEPGSPTNQPPRPGVQTLAAGPITSRSVTLNAQVNPNGPATTLYFRYGQCPRGVLEHKSPPLNGITNPGDYFITITDLDAVGLYYFYAVAINSGGKTNGEKMSFLYFGDTIGLKAVVKPKKTPHKP
jgi:hypothetical protein